MILLHHYSGDYDLYVIVAWLRVVSNFFNGFSITTANFECPLDVKILVSH